MATTIDYSNPDIARTTANISPYLSGSIRLTRPLVTALAANNNVSDMDLARINEIFASYPKEADIAVTGKDF
jgi:hypothetical protein